MAGFWNGRTHSQHFANVTCRDGEKETQAYKLSKIK